MSTVKKDDEIRRACGLLIIEVINSNPNGDPDRESDPRQRIETDDRGKISPVSFKRKLRDLVQSDLNENNRGPVWDIISRKFNPVLDPEKFCILENRDRKRKEIIDMDRDKFIDKYWDGRVFGNTFLEDKQSASKKDLGKFIKTGVAQFGVGLSIAPIKIERETITNKAGVEEGKDRGMAPLGSRYVQHGVYCMPFFINPSSAVHSGCTHIDLDLMMNLIPYAYSHNHSAARSFVGIRHAWYMEHKSPLGSCSDFKLIDTLTPKRKGDDSEKPSMSWQDYDVPTDLPQELKMRLADFRDLMDSVEASD